MLFCRILIVAGDGFMIYVREFSDDTRGRPTEDPMVSRGLGFYS